jgi:hypothetical protein
MNVEGCVEFPVRTVCSAQSVFDPRQHCPSRSSIDDCRTPAAETSARNESRSRSLGLLAVSLLSLIIAACGSNHGEQQRADYVERQTADHSALELLSTLGSSHGAKPWKLSQLGDDRIFTANLQEEIEGSSVAFRAEIIDVVRRSENEYELIVGDHLLGQDLVFLRATKGVIAEIVASPPDMLDGFFLVARIDRVQSIALELTPCDEPDCGSVTLEPGIGGVAHRVFGRLIAIEKEPRHKPGRR